MLLLNPLPSLKNVERLITQKFGENAVDYSPMNGHEGIDIACPVGTPVHSAATNPGIVVDREGNGHTEREKFYGKYLLIEYPPCKEFPNGFYLMYAHLKRAIVYMGNQIGVGQYIGETGNTGRSTGPHLHWHFQPKPVVRDNGYGGCIDFFNFVDWSGVSSQDVELYQQHSYQGRQYGKDYSADEFGAPEKDDTIPASIVFGNSKTLKVTASDGLNLRTHPSSSGVFIKTLKEGEIVDLINKDLIKKKDFSWAMVRHGTGTQGYCVTLWLEPAEIAEKFVQKVSEEPKSQVFHATKALKVKPEDSTPVAVAKTTASRTGKTAAGLGAIHLVGQIIDTFFPTVPWLQNVAEFLKIFN